MGAIYSKGGTETAGDLKMHAANAIPPGWLVCDASAINRVTYSALFNRICINQNGTTTNASASITGLADTSKMAVGMPISGTGIPAAATIASIVSGTAITISANATASGTVALCVAPWGVGDGSQTFNVPDFRGEGIRGFDAGRGIDAGRRFGSWQAAAIAAHTHTMWNYSDGSGGLQNSYPTSGNPGAVNGTISTGSTGGTETRPKNIPMLACIKY